MVINAVDKHYESDDSPYFLAELGKFFRSEGIDIPGGVRFKDYLKSRFSGRLAIVQDANTPAKIAIAPVDKEQSVRQQLSGDVSDATYGGGVDYSRLPFALVAAFCKVPSPGTNLYFRIAKPFRYETLPYSPGENYIEIEDRFRPKDLAGLIVNELSSQQKQTIYDQIEKWSEEKSFDLRAIYYDRGVKSVRATSARGEVESNALQRLINAQEPDLRGRIRIPGDIASTLMRLP